MALKDLIDKRKDVLFAEIGALIHDLGKLSKEFVEYYVESTDPKTWKEDLHSKTIFPSHLTCIDELLERIFCQYNKGNYDIVERELLNVIKTKLEKALNLRFDTNDSFLKEVEKRLKIQKKGKVKSFAELKSALTHKGKKYSDQGKGEKLDELLDQVFKPLIYMENLKKGVKEVGNFFENDFSIINTALCNILNNENIAISNFIAEHHFKTCISNTISLILAEKDGADGIDSAIDKMVTNHKIAKQSKNYTYISTAFGYENQKIDLTLPDTDDKSLTRIRNDYADKLANILENLKDIENDPDKIQNWINKREELLRETRKAFLNALGETRRPANDVTLWDHSFSVASLYKAALAQVIIDGWKAPKDIKWKLLGIRFDGNDFYNAVPKIGDLLGRKALVQKILDNIKILLEVIIPIGNEIYRDENGSVFLVPENCENEEILEIDNDVWNSIKNIKLPVELNYRGEWNEKKLENIVSDCSNIEELIEELSSFISQGIIKPKIILSKSSRGALNLGQILSEEKKWEPDVERLKQKWSGKNEGYEKCIVCNLRPVPLTDEEYENLIKSKDWHDLSEEEKNSIKAYERKECLDCLKLSLNRVEEWYRNANWKRGNPEKPSFDTSIWIDEVADENHRIALLYLKFDLEKWLNGEMLNTFLSNPLLEEEFKKQLENELYNVSDYNRLIELLEEAFNKNDFNQKFSITKQDGSNLTVKDLFQVLIGKIYATSPTELFQSIVENREPDWQDRYTCPSCATKGDNKHKAAVFLLHTTRKHPSFARLRRIWETTKNFGIDIFEEVKRKLNSKKRYVFEFTDSPNLKTTHTYYFKDDKDNKGEIVVLENNKAAVISAAKEFTPKSGQILYIFTDKFFKNQIGSLNINNVENPKPYTPIIPYQFEPSNTMFFVPLKEVWEIIKHIKKKYEIEFNKVQNRLPIKVGFVAFHKRMPMYAVLDTAKRLMETNNSPEMLKVCEISELETEENCRLFEGKLRNKVKKIKFDNEEIYYFSYATGDPNKEDLFHPYFIVENNNGWKVPISESENEKWKIIKHVKNLQTGNKVWFYPSYFDFVYLDTNTRRLDVGKERKHWLFKENSPKPYRLNQIDEFENLRELLLNKLKLTSSQLLNAYGMLIGKLQNWEIDKTDNFPITDKPFEEFVENVILSIPFRLKLKEETKKGQISRKDFEFLKKAMLNGVFFDFIDMWHTVLKRKFYEEEQNV
ncbi:CRISPR-associated protein Csx11 [Desulfurobacterium atlanticum]|uniref:CRISPR-associated protein, Csx11 family n=1 Tax=Desulfurobacterium atlanticum TaxID=240169 RepID=A0A239A1G5_9BACT|nr:CRISPR-associated protein Csx11 [Desulfurobacterium atlanticum]SNR89526.1 CRISPR-associated protein, Csx11 family [Desulfurobacterium atlanticum]